VELCQPKKAREQYLRQFVLVLSHINGKRCPKPAIIVKSGNEFGDILGVILRCIAKTVRDASNGFKFSGAGRFYRDRIPAIAFSGAFGDFHDGVLLGCGLFQAEKGIGRLVVEPPEVIA
ncbi:MAG: hypothetical protein AAGF55_04755, partial [Pseudomonadota bacterium]